MLKRLLQKVRGKTSNPDYRKVQDWARQKRNRVFIHDPQKRATPGSALRFSDRVMVVQENGSLRNIAQLPSPNRMAKIAKVNPEVAVLLKKQITG
jgi:hypothetical protein